MDRFITAIQEWPVLLQGAVGSGLFWLFLVIGQKLTTIISDKVSTLSKKKRLDELKTQIIKLQALGTNIKDGGSYASILLYRASPRVIKALIWLTFGMIFESIFNVLGVIGFIGCMYYLFSAMNALRRYDYKGNVEEKIEELNRQYEQLKES
jgi:hypothetical protein